MKKTLPDVSVNKCWSLVILAIACCSLSGCASFGRGVTEAMLQKSDKEDDRACFIRGRSFAGLEKYIIEQDANSGESRKVLKVLMVHGIGSHQPGYSTRLAENLARKLQLPRVQEKFKEIELVSTNYPGSDHANLRATRYLDQTGAREMIFFELTWDPIVEAEKQNISFDNSGEYSFRRTELNNILKLFVNSTVSDVVMYYGQSRMQIQASVGQALCWMTSETWKTLPDQVTETCDGNNKNNLDRLQDDYAFITHSLGSRVTVDALQAIAASDKDESRVERLQNKNFDVFMLSNQLPLLQLGQPAPEVAGQIAEICSPQGPKAEERLFSKTRLMAFSDPNDLFSYALPARYLDEKIDSRLCPVLTNVIINVAPLNDFFGIGKIANPMSAHTGYENDERVIDLIAKGIGVEAVSPLITERCEWIEVIPEAD